MLEAQWLLIFGPFVILIVPHIIATGNISPNTVIYFFPVGHSGFRASIKHEEIHPLSKIIDYTVFHFHLILDDITELI